MKIGGLQKTSLIDYPGKIAAVVFTQGCDMRCPYCHNPELVYPKLFKEPYPEEDFFQFLDKRRKHLEGVVITGGEPTLHSDLEDFIKQIRSYGYSVKLDTNGLHPEVIRKLISEKLIDFIAMDIKAPLTTYNLVCGTKINTEKIRSSVWIIKNSDIQHEFRTTLVPGLHTINEVKHMVPLVQGAQRYALQAFRDGVTLRADLKGRPPFPQKILEGLGQHFKPIVDHFEIRGYATE